MINNADSIIEYLGIGKPSEIDLEVIAMAFDISIEQRPLQSCEARILGTNQQAIITVNINEGNEARKRFSIAHELGHWFNDHGKSFLCQKKDISTSAWLGRTDPESRANRFAADLLMPRAMFLESVHGKPITFGTVREAAGIFSTSLTATAIRLVELTERPCLVACYDQMKRHWFSRCPTLPAGIWPTKQISHEAEAFELLYGQKTEQRAQEVDSDTWITHPDSYKYTLIEDSVQIAPGFVLVLLWWKNEDQILNLI